MKIGAVIQARMGSTRLPGKVMKEVCGRPLLSYLIERVRRSNLVDAIVVATSDLDSDQKIADFARGQNVGVFQGSETDVLDRYYQAALAWSLDLVIRITADCPLLDNQAIDEFVGAFQKERDLDYMVTAQSWPEGYDMEIFKFKVLEKAWNEAVRPLEREHVTPYIRGHPELFHIKRLECPHGDLSWMRITVDEAADFKVVKAIIEHLSPKNASFALNDIIGFLQARPDLQDINKHIIRNEGLQKSLKEEGAG